MSSIQDTKPEQLHRLLDIWRNLRKLPHGQVDDKTLHGLNVLTSKINVDDKSKEAAASPIFFEPFSEQEFDALPAYDIDNDFPQYQHRDDRAAYSYETGCDLHLYFAEHLFHNQWKIHPGSKFRLHMHAGWTLADDPDRRQYGWHTGKVTGTEWLLSEVWEHLTPGQPHVIGTLISDIESDGKLVPTELLALTQLIMATTNMTRWDEHIVFPVLLISIVGKQQARIIEGHYNGKDVLVRYSKLYDFKNDNTALVKLFLRWFMSSPVGNTKNME